MGLIHQQELLESNIVSSPGVAKLLMSVFRLNKVNTVYDSNRHTDAVEFLDKIVADLGLRYDIPVADLNNIPKTGPFIIVANHPFGIVDGILLLHSLIKVRPDLRVVANFVLKRITQLEDYFFSVNPFEQNDKSTSSYRGLKSAIRHLDQGMPLAIFPAGEVSSFNKDFPGRTDKKWSEATLKLIYNAKVPIIPVFFKGSNSWLFHALGFLNPLLRTAKLPSEALNKKSKPIKIRIGEPIPVREQMEYRDYKDLGRYLRSLVYALGNTLEIQRAFFPNWQSGSAPEPIAEGEHPDSLAAITESLKEKGYKLFGINQHEIYCAPANKLGNMLLEIGRLREETYRDVGEGTNKRIDIDEYDTYYHQLFIWDSEAKKVVGGYRIGFGKDILAMYGRTGFYSSSLFHYHKDFRPTLGQSIELGRSFIVKDYQRKSLSLFMLWKGILYVLLKHPQYRYLLGPVSISNDFTKTSKKLIIDFIKKNYFKSDIAEMIKPYNKVRFRNSGQYLNSIIEQTEGNIEKLDRTIKRIEVKNLRMPVLLKKYLELNGNIIGFNLDPAFNNCIDGLLLIDLFDIPVSVIQSFSKEIHDNALLNSILERNDIKEIIKSPLVRGSAV